MALRKRVELVREYKIEVGVFRAEELIFIDETFRVCAHCNNSLLFAYDLDVIHLKCHVWQSFLYRTDESPEITDTALLVIQHLVHMCLLVDHELV